MHLQVAGSLFIVLLCVACSGSLPHVPPASILNLATDEVATGMTKEGQPITVAMVSIVREDKDAQGNAGGYSSENKMRVSRGGSVYWLESSDKPNAFGCEADQETYEDFGCYFGTATLADLDADGEPEILSTWEQGGTGGYQSLHVYAWNGSTYRLLKVFMEMQLQYEIQDLNGDNSPEVVLRYNVGPPTMPIPWVDVYALTDKTLLSASRQYADFYRELVGEYGQRLEDLDGASDATAVEAREEVTRRMNMAKEIVGRQ